MKSYPVTPGHPIKCQSIFPLLLQPLYDFYVCCGTYNGASLWFSQRLLHRIHRTKKLSLVYLWLHHEIYSYRFGVFDKNSIADLRFVSPPYEDAIPRRYFVVCFYLKISFFQRYYANRVSLTIDRVWGKNSSERSLYSADRVLCFSYIYTYMWCIWVRLGLLFCLHWSKWSAFKTLLHIHNFVWNANNASKCIEKCLEKWIRSWNCDGYWVNELVFPYSKYKYYLSSSKSSSFS